MKHTLRNGMSGLVVLTLGITLAACSTPAVRPGAPPAKGNPGASAPRPALSTSPPTLPVPDAPTPSTATSPGNETNRLHAAPSGAVTTFFAIPPSRYYALQTRIAKLELANKAADARVNALEQALLAPRPAKRPPPVRSDEKLRTILGDTVVDPRGDELGRLVDVLVDASGRVRAAVIELGGFLGVGTRKIAVAWPLLEVRPADAKHPLVLRLTSSQLKAAHTYTGSGAVGHELVRPPPGAPASAASSQPGASG